MADDQPRSDYPALDIRFEPGPNSANVEALLYAALDDFQPIAIQEHEAADGWRVFFPQTALRDQAVSALRELALPTVLLRSVEVPDEDWARRSQANLTAITVGQIVVAPPWDLPPVEQSGRPSGSGVRIADRDPNPTVVIIDPSMGFGTGHHQTTRLCLLLLQSIDLAGRSLIDVGTGSGVLAIAAAKLGAVPITAVDTDPDALQNARENVARNGVVVEIVQSDVRNLSADPADVVVGNLTAGVLEQHARALRRLSKRDGAVIVSGFGPHESSDVIAALGGTLVRREIDGEWAAALLRV